MQVQIVDLPAVRLATLRKVGPYGEAISLFWKETCLPWLAEQHLLANIKYGIGYDNPYITPANECRYDAGVEVPADFLIQIPAVETTLAAGQYAVYAFEGASSDIVQAWKMLMQDWLPKSGYELANLPCFERHIRPVSAETVGLFACDICIPLKSKSV